MAQLKLILFTITLSALGLLFLSQDAQAMGNTCGNGTCNFWENCSTCPGDCGPCAPAVSCAATCSTAGFPTSQCRWQSCNSGETNVGQTSDCDGGALDLNRCCCSGSAPPPPPPPPPPPAPPPSASTAPTNEVACGLATTSLGQNFAQPSILGDINFLKSKAAPPNIMWLLDTSGSMANIVCLEPNLPRSSSLINHMPCEAFAPASWGSIVVDDNGDNDSDWLDGDGSNDFAWPADPAAGTSYKAYSIFLDALGYSPSTTYPVIDPDFADLFSSAKVYRHGTDYTGSNVHSSVAVFCGTQAAAKQAGCIWSLNNKGYWTVNETHNSNSDFQNHDFSTRDETYFIGNFLNFYSPKFIAATKALKDVILATASMRMGLATFDSSGSGSYPYLDVISNTNPGCGAVFSAGGANYEANRGALKNRLNNIIKPSSTAGATAFNGSTPLGRATDSIGKYFSQASNAICSAGFCAGNFAILITDGAPSNESGETTTFTPFTSVKDVDANGTPGHPFLLDEVGAKLFAGGPAGDLRTSSQYPGQQTMITYAISFGLINPTDSSKCIAILDETAKVSDGVCLPANSSSELRDRLNQILDIISRRSQSFSNVAVNTFGLSSREGTILPRFLASANALWRGELLRFELVNEAGINLDLNCDGAKDADVLVDGDGDTVGTEASEGQLVKRNRGITNNVSGDCALTNTPAVPFWEAGDQLCNNCAQDVVPSTTGIGHAARKIYTTYDSNNDGLINASDDVIAFNTANAATLVDYLVPQGTDFCGQMATRLGLPILPGGPDFNSDGVHDSADRELCGANIIRYIRGQDIFDNDTDGITTDDREWLLGDIFHSTPTLVGQPASTFLCDRGLSPQCLLALYGSSVPMVPPLGSTSVPHAYDAFRNKFGVRSLAAVVSSNDGLIHGINAGNYVTGDDPNTTAVVESFYFDSGTGQETWAFVPPDQLSKLYRVVFRDSQHQFFADATPMIREVWVDGLQSDNTILSSAIDNKKQEGEYRTIMIMGERRGGSHFFALDITKSFGSAKSTAPSEVKTAAPPDFLWIFPQPNSTKSFIMGESWSESTPSPPSIGPVRISETVSTKYPMGFSERWSLLINAGFDPVDLRGRGVFMLDAWRGDLLWEFAYDPYDLPTTGSEQENLKFSIPGTPAFIDFRTISGGSETLGQQDYYFDLGVVGDTGGQIWAFDFGPPATFDISSGLVNNWPGRRVFRQSQTASAAADLINNQPFYHIPSATPTSSGNKLRIFMGTGDRFNAIQCEGGDCTAYNYRSCVRKGCGTIADFGMSISGHELSLSSTHTPTTFGGTTVSAATPSRDSCDKLATHYTTTIQNCPGTTAEDDFVNEQETEFLCEGTAPFLCMNNDSSLLTSAINPSFTAADLPKNKFYAINIYPFPVGMLTQADLVDVTTTGIANEASNGWFYEYPDSNSGGSRNLDESTTSGATIIGGCILWPSFLPNCSSGDCGSIGNSKGFLNQADFITGRPNCAGPTFGSNRSIQVGVSIPPPPITRTTLNNGTLSQSVILATPGSSDPLISITINSTSDLFRNIYWLEVDKSLHKERSP